METISSTWRNSLRSKPSTSPSSKSSMDTNNNGSSPITAKKTNYCNICSKKLFKVARWRNYFILPCRCHHVFCKECITGRIECRQKVLQSLPFDLMWTFPCPGSKECGQEIVVDWSRGPSYSRNLVAQDIVQKADDVLEEEGDEESLSGIDTSDMSWEEKASLEHG